MTLSDDDLAEIEKDNTGRIGDAYLTAAEALAMAKELRGRRAVDYVNAAPDHIEARITVAILSERTRLLRALRSCAAKFQGGGLEALCSALAVEIERDA